MDTFVTTYQKAYTWPYAKKGKGQDGEVMVEKSTEKKEFSSFKASKLSKVTTDMNLLKSSDSEKCIQNRSKSRESLKQPKIHPAKPGPCPVSDASKHNQPDNYIKKLEDKFPGLYGVSKPLTPDELVTRMETNRLKTTYQKDYCGNNSANSLDIDQRTDAERGVCPPCRASMTDVGGQMKAKRGQWKDKSKKLCGKGKDTNEDTSFVRFRSEYEDVIGATGQAIVKSAIHESKRSKFMPAWASKA